MPENINQRQKILHLTMTSDPDGSAWAIAEAKQRMESALRKQLSMAMISAKGPIILTLELYSGQG